jgi:putative nucleotide binding protein
MRVEKSQSGRPYAGRSAAEKPSYGGRRPTGKPQSNRQSERAPRSSGKSIENSQEREEYAWVLDYLPYGKSVDGPVAYQKKPLVQAVGDKKFTLIELIPKSGVIPQIQSRVYIGSGDRNEIDHVKQRIGHSDLTTGANLELPFILEACVRYQEPRFVKFFNDAHSITTRLHMLDLLPAIRENSRVFRIFGREFQVFMTRLKSLPIELKKNLRMISLSTGCSQLQHAARKLNESESPSSTFFNDALIVKFFNF